MRPRICLILPALIPALLLAACGKGKDGDAVINDADPAIAAALNSRLMVDPDLVSQNRGDAAAAGGGPASAPIPAFPRGTQMVTAAKDAASRLLGGSIRSAPSVSQRGDEAFGAQDAATIAAHALGASASAACAAKLGWTARWAAGLPDGVPIYPHGHVQEAAGSDAAGCQLRVINYRTLVEPSDVIDFTFSAASKAGFDAVHSQEGGDDVLIGKKGAASYAVYARKLADGSTEVDLVISGL